MRRKSLPEAAGCAANLCRRRPHAPQISAAGGRMRRKSLPEAAGCDASLCRRRPDARATPRRRLPESSLNSGDACHTSRSREEFAIHRF